MRYDVHDVMAAGGHQGYAAVGGLFTQSRPLEAHLFGPISEQLKRVPVRSYCPSITTITANVY